MNSALKPLAECCRPVQQLGETTLIALTDYFSMLITFHSHLIRKLVRPRRGLVLFAPNKTFTHPPWLLTIASPDLILYLADTILRAEVPGGQVGGYGEVLLVHHHPAVPQQRQPRRTHCGESTGARSGGWTVRPRGGFIWSGTSCS